MAAEGRGSLGAEMVSFTVRLRFDVGDVAEVEELLCRLTTESRKEPGCVSYVAHVVESSPDTILIYEQYKDQAALEAHRASAHFDQYAVKGFYQMMKNREMETLIALC